MKASGGDERANEDDPFGAPFRRLMGERQYALAVPLGEERLEAITALKGEAHRDAVMAAANLAEAYHQLTLHDRAKELLERALANSEGLADSAPAVMIGLLSQLAKVHRVRGDHDRAEALYERAREVPVRSERAHLDARCGALQGYGLLLGDLGRLDEAEALLRDCLATTERLHGAESVAAAGVMSNLAVNVRQQHREPEAEALYRRALAILEAAHGSDHFDLVNLLTNLGVACHTQGRNDEAEALQRRALALCERVEGPETGALADVLASLTDTRTAQGHLDEARALGERALALRERLLGDDHPRCGDVLTKLAPLHLIAGDNEKGEAMTRRALAIAERRLGPHHPDLVTSLVNLSVVCRRKGDLDEARALAERALAIQDEALPETHPNRVDVYRALAEIALKSEDHAAAMKHFTAAIRQVPIDLRHTSDGVALILGASKAMRVAGHPAEACEQLKLALKLTEHRGGLGAKHVLTAQVLYELGGCQFDARQFKVARVTLQRAVHALEAHHGATSRKLVEPLRDLALVLAVLGEHSRAEPLYLRALAIAQKRGVPWEPYVVDTQYLLADLYVAMRRYADARVLFEQAMAAMEPIVGSESPRVGQILAYLGQIAIEENDVERALTMLPRAVELMVGHKGLYSHVTLALQRLISVAKLIVPHPDKEALTERLKAALEASSNAMQEATRRFNAEAKTPASGGESGLS